MIELQAGPMRELGWARVTEFLKIRATVFCEELDWVRCDEHEVDPYDLLNPTYLILSYRDAIIAGVRFLPTTGPYMLRDVFRQLLGDHPPPREEGVYESSRFFALEPTPELGLTRVDLACLLMDAMVEHARVRGWHRIVSVSDIRLERIARQNGIKVHRFGRPCRIGNTLAMAGWTDIPPKTVPIPNAGMLLDATASVQPPLVMGA